MATWQGKHTQHTFNSLQELEFSIGAETSEILEYVMENVVLPKLKEYIENDVYKYNAEWDGRTGEFKDAWKIGLQRQGFYNNISLYLDDSAFSYGYPNPFTHNMYSASGLAEIINEGWNSSYYAMPPYGFPAIEARPYWKDFIEWMDENFGNEFLKECNKRGINMIVTNDLRFEYNNY